METTTPSCPALPENHDVAARSSSQITSSFFLDVLLGVCTATGLPEQTVERFRQCLSPPSSQISPSCSSSKSAVEENFQINSGAKCWFSGQNDVLARFLSENDAELRHLLNLGLVVTFLRESRQQSRIINRKDLTVLWDVVHNALISQFSCPLSTISYRAEGFFIIPLCSLTGQNGDDDELYGLHIWLPENQRDPDSFIHSYQAPFQSWVLVGGGQHSTFKVESTACRIREQFSDRGGPWWTVQPGSESSSSSEHRTAGACDQDTLITTHNKHELSCRTRNMAYTGGSIRLIARRDLSAQAPFDS
jgi:hypothetical protein